MANELWWGQSKWSWPGQLNPAWNSGWLEIRGSISGPGKGNIGALDQTTYTLSLLGQYWLTPNRMDPCPDLGGHSSLPTVKLRGQLRGDTNAGLLFDKPDLNVDLVIEQTAYFDGYRYDHARTTQRIFDLPQKANKNDRKYFGPSTGYSAPSLGINLQRHQNKTLNINVEAKLKIYLEGWATLDPRQFAMSIPQWTLTDNCYSPPDRGWGTGVHGGVSTSTADDGDDDDDW